MSSRTIIATLLALALMTTATMLLSTTGEAASSTPIAINGNADLDDQAYDLGWPGDGSFEHPYLIADLIIDTPGSAGISIQNTDRHVIVRNCTVSGAVWDGSDYGRGIWLSGTSNVTVEMSTFDSNDFGIYVQASDGITLLDNVITSSTGVGIYVETTRGTAISNCSIATSIGTEAVYLMESTQCVVIHNTVTGTGNGVYMLSSDNNLIIGNELSVPGVSFYAVDSDDNAVSGNGFYGGDYGVLIELLDSDRCTISDNTIEAETEVEIDILGIAIAGDSAYNTVDGNDVYYTTEGIAVYHPASFTSVSNNTVTGTDCGIRVLRTADGVGASYTEVVNNIVRSSTTGICLESVSFVIAANNTVENCFEGIRVDSCSDLILADNTLTNIETDGILMLSSTATLERINVTRNAINFPLGHGIFADLATDCSFWGNTVSVPGGNGITLLAATDCLVSRNEVLEAGVSGLFMGSSSANIVSWNLLVECVDIGIHLEDSDGDAVTDNLVVDTSIGIILQETNGAYVARNYVLLTSFMGIMVDGSCLNVIDGNYLMDSGECGIAVLYDLPMAPMAGPGTSIGFSGNAITNNTIVGETYCGIALMRLDDNRVLNNTVSGCSEGISVHESSWNVIADNVITDAYSGIVLYMADGCTVRSNTITNATENGIWLDLCNDNAVEDNRISGLQTNGILLGEGGMKAAPGIEYGYDLSYNIVSGNVIEGGTFGVVLNGCSDSAVTDNRISGAEYVGILLEDVFGITVSENTIIGYTEDGIYLGDCYESVIRGNLVEDCYDGVDASYSELNLIAGNIIHAEGDGIYLSLADHNRLYGNSIEAMGAGICLYSSIADLQGNVMTGCAIRMGFGDVYDEETFTAQMNILENNTVNGRPVLFLHDADMDNDGPGIGYGEIILLNVSRFNVVGHDLTDAGVIIAFSDNITVLRNMITNALVGISVHRSVDCGLSDNTIAFYPDGRSYYDATGIEMVQSERIITLSNRISLNVDQPGESELYWYGLSMYECSDCDVINNAISVRGSAATTLYFSGIVLTASVSNYVSQNIITDEATFPHDGIGLDLSHGNNENRFNRNVISGMPYRGVSVFGSHNNVFFANDISFSGGYGIHIWASTNNILTGNRLTGNNGVDEDLSNSQAYDDSSNQWNDLAYGNIWSDWSAPDSDHDGIVDLPYAIDGGAFDNKPVTVYFELTSPAGSPSYTDIASLTLEGTALDAIGIYQVSWRNIDTGDSGTCTGTTAWSATLPLAVGDNRIIVTLNDLADLDFEVEVVVVHTTGPVISTTPGPTNYTNEADFQAEVEVSDLAPLTGGNWTHYLDGVEVAHGAFEGIAGLFEYSATFAPALGVGTNLIVIQMNDTAGASDIYQLTVVYDDTAPTLHLDAPTEDLFNTDSVTVEWHAEDALSGIDRFELCLDGGEWSVHHGNSYTFSGLADGLRTVTVRAFDRAGNFAELAVSFTIDVTAPEVAITAPEEGSFLTTASATATWLAADATSDLGSVSIRIDGGAWQDALGMSQWIFSDLAEGSHTIDIWAVDRAGNEAVDSVTFTVDTVAPSSEASADGEAGTSGWFLGDVTVTLSATDATSGVRDIEFRLDGGAWTAYAQPIVLTGEGVFTIEHRATDEAGNVEETGTFTVSIDRTAPEAEILSPSQGDLLGPGSNVTWTASDGVSGLLGLEYRVDEEAWTSSSDHSFDLGELADGLHTFALRAIDVAGNVAELSVSFTIDTTAPTVVSKSPEGAEVDLDAEIVVEFSEAVNQTSVEMAAGAAGTISWEGNTLTFVPAAKRSANTTYAVVITGRDLAGNKFSVTWSFKTTDLGGLSGTVVGPDGQPVAGATVTLSNGMNATTDPQGRFSFAGVAEGSYTLSIGKEGFEDATREVTVVAGENSPVGALSLQAAEPAGPSGSLDLVLIGGIAAAVVAALAIALVVMRGRNKA